MKIRVTKDGKGFLAKVTGTPHCLIAYGNSKKEALKELHGILEVHLEISLEEVTEQLQLKDRLQKKLANAV